jgi:hypothetical protein
MLKMNVLPKINLETTSRATLPSVYSSRGSTSEVLRAAGLYYKIRLTQGKYTIINKEDLPFISYTKWHSVKKSNGRWYAISGDGLAMHRILLNAPNGCEVDHINHNGLDNRRCNLRLASHAQNAQNKRKIAIGTSKYKGVSFDSRNNKWRAEIKKTVNGKLLRLFLGLFEVESDAALAYNDAATKHFGEFACCNFS